MPTEWYQQNLDTLLNVTERSRQRMLGKWRETYGEEFKHAPGYEAKPFPTKPPEPSGKPTARVGHAAPSRPLTHNGREVIKVDGKYVDKEIYERAQ
jgi:hypothetical protein